MFIIYFASVAYALAALFLLTALIIIKIRYGEDKVFFIKGLFLVLLWPITVIRGLFDIFDDHNIDLLEAIVIVYTAIFWYSIFLLITIL